MLQTPNQNIFTCVEFSLRFLLVPTTSQALHILRSLSATLISLNSRTSPIRDRLQLTVCTPIGPNTKYARCAACPDVHYSIVECKVTTFVYLACCVQSYGTIDALTRARCSGRYSTGKQRKEHSGALLSSMHHVYPPEPLGFYHILLPEEDYFLSNLPVAPVELQTPVHLVSRTQNCRC